MKFKGIRSDISYFTTNMETANICRIYLYENKKYILKENDNILDIDGLFTTPNNNITINDIMNMYQQLEEKYINLIPLWETPQQNLKKYPDLYNDSKWIIGKREEKRKHHKLLILNNGFKFKIGYLWSHQLFNQRPTYNKKFVKTFKVVDNQNNIITENENWGAILAQSQQYLKDNALEYYKDYTKKITILGYCKSENIWFDIVKFDILKNKWFI